MKNEITIRQLNNTDFVSCYGDFVLQRNTNNNLYLRMLSVATLFINCEDEKIKRLGYRIIVMYCNQTKDYKPLYEIAVNWGLIPISKFIEKTILKESGNVYTELNASIGESFFVNNVYCSIQQKELIDFFENYRDKTVSVVAPTSYGKTELILSTIENCQNSNICVLTPTKSLLAQTKMRLLRSKIKWVKKIITHPEMYNGQEENLVAILTQERLLRLLKKDETIKFDYIIVDEAHDLLKDDSRNQLLASVILVLNKRNSNTVFKFLTPFLSDPSNMKVRYADYTIQTHQVSEYIKTEKLYLVELRKGQREFVFYDQFINKYFPMVLSDEVVNEWTFVQAYSSGKNIVYLNKPKDIERLVNQICNSQEQITSKKIEEACENIAEYVHPKYKMIDCLKHGAIYHHGSVPESIRTYIENLYTELDEIKYVITSSTLLEGVNIPADNMFILDNKKGRKQLSPSDFKNLIGRVCRFGQIFHPKTGSLQRLEPNIYLVAGRYYTQTANVKGFIKNTMNVEKKIEDKLDNVLLEKTEITCANGEKLNVAEEFVENYEEGIIKDYDLRKVETPVGKSCFINNITEFDVFEEEKEISQQAEKYKENEEKISDTAKLFEVLYLLFFLRAEDDDNIKRFQYKETQAFYKMFLDWRISNTALNFMINAFVRYWKGLIESSYKDKMVYVGSRWGDEKRDGFLELWTDVSTKTDVELINLAIVRIKEEQDFLENTVLKYVEVLYDMDMIEEELYLNIKYGTSNQKIIVCIKNGLSYNLAKVLIEKYSMYVFVDLNNNTIQFAEGIIEALISGCENKILIHEMSYYL